MAKITDWSIKPFYPWPSSLFVGKTTGGAGLGLTLPAKSNIRQGNPGLGIEGWIFI
jgi:hypothetical protein